MSTNKQSEAFLYFAVDVARVCPCWQRRIAERLELSVPRYTRATDQRQNNRTIQLKTVECDGTHPYLFLSIQYRIDVLHTTGPLVFVLVLLASQSPPTDCNRCVRGAEYLSPRTADRGMDSIRVYSVMDWTETLRTHYSEGIRHRTTAWLSRA